MSSRTGLEMREKIDPHIIGYKKILRVEIQQTRIADSCMSECEQVFVVCCLLLVVLVIWRWFRTTYIRLSLTCNKKKREPNIRTRTQCTHTQVQQQHSTHVLLALRKREWERESTHNNNNNNTSSCSLWLAGWQADWLVLLMMILLVLLLRKSLPFSLIRHTHIHGCWRKSQPALSLFNILSIAFHSTSLICHTDILAHTQRERYTHRHEYNRKDLLSHNFLQSHSQSSLLVNFHFCRWQYSHSSDAHLKMLDGKKKEQQQQ